MNENPVSPTDHPASAETPERIGKWIGDIIAALIMISVVVMMIVQFA